MVSGGDEGALFAQRLREHGLSVRVVPEREVHRDDMTAVDLVVLCPDTHYAFLSQRGVLATALPVHLLIGEARLLGTPLGIPYSPAGQWRRGHQHYRPRTPPGGGAHRHRGTVYRVSFPALAPAQCAARRRSGGGHP